MFNIYTNNISNIIFIIINKKKIILK